MKEIKKELESEIKVEVINWKKNRGKRDAMAEGIKLATHEIIIFIDSDSFIEKNCVKHLVKYFSNPKVGAVSGHTDVYNRNTNLLTQMQSARYYVSFKIYKSAESIFGLVTCCPGCNSAYRREYLLEYVDAWQNQYFFGRKCTFGDDRSLTNFIIKKYLAIYSPEAIAHTVVPNTFKVYSKQQLRWKKSWIRETFIASTFMYKKNPFASISFYMCLLLTFASPIVFIRAIFYYPITSHHLPIMYLFGLLLMLILHGTYYRMYVGKQSWFLAIVSFWVHTILLMWQLPWALIKMNDTRWGTR